MKILINKNNPAIRITAPEIIETSLYYVLDFANDDNDYETDLLKYDWTLVEEEEDIRKVLEKYHLEYVNKGYNDHPLEIAEYFFKLGRNGR